ncbi:BAG family molecular chaperone regulator 2-like [Diospyros lotus]|uniref:BAG family molecular chaperone regulator 2-like n=1 Tax=Diospyros lotus TaxID=55363 RepID=UPI00225B578B|nr:BAG family molecular chaperone regulator 2-like [Diospyros lotus]XP_052179301.1 BAG family molecular chaperone regulator 2-like [Diospyros lotus]XP_052179302.1 BAG family molecular chaperone regulator 2-like [Diospyros lotus]XP_052179303.1 BAG family molecular chaperone regulator 2-like [Diospyros lotus]XP_052179304.1 BAG family molecular chaperone regulator 2-like [Diospyros lotus]XP_052179305.1 BAG family molecular chaperone regulator 2-like [Diospyros lotus]
MIKRKLNFSRGTTDSSDTTMSREEGIEWEMRPGGMLVQKRTDNSDSPAPNLRLRVAYGAVRYEIFAGSQATFGELKKLLEAESGLQPAEQRLIFRGKERENGEYLDMCGVKDRSKVILIEDPSSRERRLIEMRQNAKIQAAYSKINDVSVEVDKLTGQVSAIEKSIATGNKVAEVQITTLIEMLMRLAVKLDSIPAEGDASLQKNLQGMRVQKCVETLDVLKVSNARIKPVIVTTKWETFDPPPPPPPPPASTHWELFDS